MHQKKKNVHKSYEATAELYDKRYIAIQYQKFREIEEEIIGTDEKGKILDVGAGTGLLRDYFNKLKNNIFLLDLSFAMLKQAQNKDPHTFLICADGEKLPIKSESFELITCISVIQNFPNPIQSLKEQRRVLKKNGKIIITALKKIYSESKLKKTIESAGLKVNKLFVLPIEDIGAIAEKK